MASVVRLRWPQAPNVVSRGWMHKTSDSMSDRSLLSLPYSKSRSRSNAGVVQIEVARVLGLGVRHGDVCSGCRRRFSEPAGIQASRKARRGGPVMQAVAREDRDTAGHPDGHSQNRASKVQLAGAPPLNASEPSNGSARSANETNVATAVGIGKVPTNNAAQLTSNGAADSRAKALAQLRKSQVRESNVDGPSLPQRLWRKLIRSLSSLNLAIGTLLTIAGFSALGTVIEQNKSYQFYIDNYPEENPSFGFLNWKVLLDLELDHIYTSWWFLSLLAFLAASLMACTSTRQLPMAKVARRWRFLKTKAQFRDMDVMEDLPRAKVADLASMLNTKGYQVFSKGPSLYAFKGLAGKLGPIGVHVGLILTMGGCAYSATAGFDGSSMTPQGQEFFIGDVLRPVGFLSRAPSAEQYRVHVNNFSIDYMPNGNVNQFYSDLSVIDLNDKEVYHKTIKVNDPLRYQGVTMYQTDWNLASLQAKVDGGQPFRLPMAILDNGEGKTGKLFGTFLRTGPADEPRGVSIVARDFLSVAVYGPDGAFVGVRRPGSNKPIKVDGREIVIDELIGATGMQLKYDPGVPFVYAGFGILIITTITSQISHDQLWALEEGGALIVGARSSKAKNSIASDLDYLFEKLPEYVPSEKDRQAAEQAPENRTAVV